VRQLRQRSNALTAAFWAASWAALCGAWLLGASAWSADAPELTAPAPRPVQRVLVRQAISGATTGFLQDALAQAASAHAQALLIELDTPGGTLDATREVVQLILASRVPVLVYVAPQGARAASAGTLITLAAHVAAMAPGTHIGAAHPVSLFGGPEDKVMGEKIVNDTAAFAESLAQLRHRNAEWAVAAVRESRSITESAALKQKVVDLIAEDAADLMRQVDGRQVALSKSETVTLHTRDAALLTQNMSVPQGLLGWLSHPDVVFLFLIGGLIGLYIEFSHPGLLFPGIAGALSLLIALVALQMLPVRYGAVGLIVLGAALLIAEAYVTSFGLLAAAGLGSLLLGSLFLFDEAKSDLAVSRTLIGVTVAALAILALVVGRLLVRSQRMPGKSAQANLVGQHAEVVTAVGPRATGRVQLLGERWKARAGTDLPKGTRVVVRRVEGLLLEVEAEPAEPAAGPRAN